MMADAMSWFILVMILFGIYVMGHYCGRSDERKRIMGLMYSTFQRTHSSQTLRWVLNAVVSGARTLGPKEEFFPPALVGFTEEEPSSVASFESSMDGLQRAVDASSINPDGVRTEMRAVLDELKREHPDCGRGVPSETQMSDGPLFRDVRSTMTKSERTEQYPEHQKLKTISSQLQTVGSFLEWILENKVTLAVRHEHDEHCYNDRGYLVCDYCEDELMPGHFRIEALLAEFFEIDQEKLENEKQAMIEELRK